MKRGYFAYYKLTKYNMTSSLFSKVSVGQSVNEVAHVPLVVTLLMHDSNKPTEKRKNRNYFKNKQTNHDIFSQEMMAWMKIQCAGKNDKYNSFKKIKVSF